MRRVFDPESTGAFFGAPLAPPPPSSEADDQRSPRLRSLLEADVLFEGHCGVFEGRDEVGRFIESFMEGDRERAVG